ncbi:MAG: FAD-binding oxidoreductase [Chloroflexi bacterium]|nr:FAD-binding oxidoreductase [Chloroflexota bacterium]MCI0581004.1 FAD-binding oxidoreductase [Chloroflexota bacterium]MCI0646343.1 FAD-binding oxidoreductase [Chloroflexota bacterium]MCI0728399.1 FAD-binding oxidoreductase [Chloroflexota bacterium]
MIEEKRRVRRQNNEQEIPGDQLFSPLPADKLENVPAWGGASSAMGYVFRPSTTEGLRDVFDLARRSGRSVGLRGAGNSYGDAPLNSEQITLDMQRMNRILAWDPAGGRIQVEPGVTMAQLWQYALEDGWWPAVVPGTMHPTIGGCAGMNIHGKNAWKVGTIGDHIYEFDLMLPSGEIIACSREKNADLFHAAIGGFGVVGTFTSITLSLKRVYSGLLNVEALASGSLKEMLAQFDEHLPTADYLVGWIDALARGKSLGRGQIHKANYLPPGADPNPSQTLRLDRQHLPDTLLGFVPRSIMWRFMQPFMNNAGTRLVNMGKYWSSRFTHGQKYQQPHAAFHFLLNYIPDWKKSYGPGGLIQYQSFIPAENTLDAFSEMLRLCQRRGLPNYLSVLKRHRPDNNFLITHALDGYSLAMDFRITPRRRAAVVRLAAELDEIVLAAGGRFYLAKDSTLRPEVAVATLGRDTIDRFRALKARCDPDNILQTNLWRRIFVPIISNEQ